MTDSDRLAPGRLERLLYDPLVIFTVAFTLLGVLIALCVLDALG